MPNEFKKRLLITFSSVKKRRKDQSNAYFGANVLQICRQADLVFIALHGANGENGKVQAAFDLLGIDYTGCDYFSSALSSNKSVSKQLAQNPKAEICAFKDGAWLRLAGELVNDDRIEAKKSMLDAYANLRGMYDENDDNTQVLYIKNAVATFSSFGAPAEVITF